MTDVHQMLTYGVAERHAREGTGRCIREQANVSQKLMAQAVGITVSGLWRWENGQRRPRGEAAVKWVEILDKLARANAKKVA